MHQRKRIEDKRFVFNLYQREETKKSETREKKKKKA